MRPWFSRRRTCVLVLLALAACGSPVTAPSEAPPAVRRADEAFRYREYDAAIKGYRSYVDESPHDDYTPVAFYKMALSQYLLGRYHEALGTLDELAERYPKRHWVQVDALRGDADHKLGLSVTAIQAWDQGWAEAAASDRPKLRRRIVDVARSLNETDLAKAHALVESDDVARLLRQEIARRQSSPHPPAQEPAVATAEVAAAPHGAAAPAPALAPPTPVEEELPAAVPPPPAPPAAAATPAAVGSAVANAEDALPGGAKVGCLLPLSGPDREFGERALRGIQLAFGPGGSRLIVKDTATAPPIGMAMFEQLVSTPDVVLIIGPLRSDTAAEVAPHAEQTQLPTLLLSQRDGLEGQFVLQAGMTRSRQVEALLNYAMGRVRLQRFGVLYPKDAYGEDFLTAFRTAVSRRGGEVVGADAYAPGAVNGATDTLMRWRQKDNLQALFVPDTADAALPVSRFLQRRMPDVTLLGVHGWESLAAQQSPTGVNGVVFTDGFYADSTRPATRDFVERFVKTYGAPPGALEAQAYDAALLARRALDAGASSRLDALKRLQGLGIVAGATGDLRVTPQGLQRDLFLLQVYEGKLQELRSAG